MDKISENGRNIYIDIIKGIAAFYVVLGHTISSDSVLFRCINTVHMPLFFIIAGYFAFRTYEKKSCITIIISKARRLIIPYLILNAAAVLFKICVDLIKGNGLSKAWDYFLHSFWYAESVWFFVVLFFAFVLHCAVKFLSDKKLVFLIPLLLIIVIFALPNKILMLCKLKTMYPYFFIGYCLNYSKIKFSKKNLCFIGGVSLLLYFLILVLLYNKQIFIDYTEFSFGSSSVISALLTYLLYTFVGLLGCAFYFSAVYLIPVKHKLLCRFGDFGKYSMDIYMIHPFLINVFAMIPAIHLFEYGLIPLIFQLLSAVIISTVSWQAAKRILYRIKLYQILFTTKAVLPNTERHSH